MNVAARSFASGELAPALHAQTNLAAYARGLRTCLNFVPGKAGGARNRPGTLYVGRVRGDVDDPVRLIPWVRSDTEAYCLVFTHLRMWVVLNGEYVPLGSVPAWTNVTTYVEGDVVAVTGVNYECTVGHLSSPLTQPGVGGSWGLVWAVTTESIYWAVSPFWNVDLPGVRWAHDADVMTLVHTEYPVQELTRVADDDWTFADAAFGPVQAPVSGVGATGGAAGTDTWYAVSAVSAETGEESIVLTAVDVAKIPTTASPITVSWTGASGAARYRVYKQAAGAYYGLIGEAIDPVVSFVDDGIEPDAATRPPAARDPFDATDKYPGAVTHYQQRRVFARTNEKPETSWASRSALPSNFTVSSVVQDDDAVTWTLRGKRVNEVRHLVDHDALLEFTSHGVYAVRGDANGVLTPAGVNPRQVSPYGASDLGALAPISTGLSLLYAASRGAAVRALGLSDSGAYGGEDITVQSGHLFEGRAIVDWALQETPDPVLWAVRSDGVLLGCTYVPEASVLAWHRHEIAGGADDDGNAVVENVCVVPEGDEDVLYLVVRRTVDGSAIRSVERMGTRTLRAAPPEAGELDDDVRVLDGVGFVDGAVVSDGWLTPNLGETLTLTGAAYDAGASLTLTAATFTPFVVGDVGRTIFVESAEGDRARLAVTAYTSSTVVTVEPEAPVPAALRAVSAARYAWGQTTVSGLDHLEGEAVSVVADGEVVANPNDDDLTVVTVASGAITLERAYAHIRVGLPYVSDLETLDIDVPGGSSRKPEGRILVNKVGVIVERTRSLRAGPDADNLDEFVLRTTSDWGGLPPLQTGYYEASVRGGFTSHGRVLVRQRDPLPATVLSIMPSGSL